MLALVVAVLPASAQIDANLGALTAENVKGYLGPLPTALSGTLSTSIFQSGNVPKSGITFSIGVKAMVAGFDDKDRTYTPTSPPGFSSSTQVKAPTVIGDVNAVQQDGDNGTVLYHPGGFDVQSFGLAVPQLTIGNILGTQAVVRWVRADVGDSDFGEVSLFGAGLQHSISQYFEGLPVDLAAGAFYQKFTIRDDLMDTKLWHVDVTASKNISFMQPYIGLGYDSFDMSVRYEPTTGGSSGTELDVKFDTKSNVHLTAGAQIKLAILKLNAEFNQAATTTVAVGLSLGN
jgi:hypothetical protein